MAFCLRPSAKDQGITWVVLVVVLVLHHLVHFLFKRNLSEKKSPWLGIKPGSFGSTAKHLSTELQSHRYNWCENWFLYLATDLGPVLVHTCYLRNDARTDTLAVVQHPAFGLRLEVVLFWTKILRESNYINIKKHQSSILTECCCCCCCWVLAFAAGVFLPAAAAFFAAWPLPFVVGWWITMLLMRWYFRSDVRLKYQVVILQLFAQQTCTVPSLFKIKNSNSQAEHILE